MKRHFQNLHRLELIVKDLNKHRSDKRKSVKSETVQVSRKHRSDKNRSTKSEIVKLANETINSKGLSPDVILLEPKPNHNSQRKTVIKDIKHAKPRTKPVAHSIWL